MTVSFHLPDDAPETPVDVYDERLGLVGRCLSTEELTTMTPGQYFAIARPFGEPPLAAVFDVGEDAHTPVRLVPQPVAAEPEATVVFGHDFWPEAEGGRQPLSEAGEVGGQSWNLHVARTSWALPSSQHGSSRPLDWVDVRLFTHTGATQCCILHREAWRHLRPTVRHDLGGQVALVMQLRHPIARELLAFLGSGRIAHAEALCRSNTLEPWRLLGGSRERDPIAAAARAFALIKLGEADRVHEETEGLRYRFPWLADGAVADAERLARLDRHDEAVQALRELSSRGLPCLQVALTAAVTLLRRYRKRIHDATWDALMRDLNRYALASDLTAEVTTFRADHPLDPRPRA